MAVSLAKLVKVEPLVVSKEEMQTLYLDGGSIRRYCLQCRGPKFLVPSKRVKAFNDSMAEQTLPDKYPVVCKTCGMKYTAKLATE